MLIVVRLRIGSARRLGLFLRFKRAARRVVNRAARLLERLATGAGTLQMFRHAGHISLLVLSLSKGLDISACNRSLGTGRCCRELPRHVRLPRPAAVRPHADLWLWCLAR